MSVIVYFVFGEYLWCEFLRLLILNPLKDLVGSKFFLFGKIIIKRIDQVHHFSRFLKYSNFFLLIYFLVYSILEYLIYSFF